MRVTRNRLVVALPEGVLFDTGSAVLKASGRAVLEQIGAVLRTMDRDFQVAANDTVEGRGSNRRTEIVLVPAYDELPDLSALRDAPASH